MRKLITAMISGYFVMSSFAQVPQYGTSVDIRAQHGPVIPTAVNNNGLVALTRKNGSSGQEGTLLWDSINDVVIATIPNKFVAEMVNDYYLAVNSSGGDELNNGELCLLSTLQADGSNANCQSRVIGTDGFGFLTSPLTNAFFDLNWLNETGYVMLLEGDPDSPNYIYSVVAPDNTRYTLPTNTVFSSTVNSSLATDCGLGGLWAMSEGLGVPSVYLKECDDSASPTGNLIEYHYNTASQSYGRTIINLAFLGGSSELVFEAVDNKLLITSLDSNGTGFVYGACELNDCVGTLSSITGDFSSLTTLNGLANGVLLNTEVNAVPGGSNNNDALGTLSVSAIDSNNFITVAYTLESVPNATWFDHSPSGNYAIAVQDDLDFSGGYVDTNFYLFTQQNTENGSLELSITISPKKEEYRRRDLLTFTADAQGGDGELEYRLVVKERIQGQSNKRVFRSLWRPTSEFEFTPRELGLERGKEYNLIVVIRDESGERVRNSQRIAIQ